MNAHLEQDLLRAVLFKIVAIEALSKILINSLANVEQFI